MRLLETAIRAILLLAAGVGLAQRSGIASAFWPGF